ncbi:HupE/UreJ family protein (plasmid) [Coraliomargarita sp. W4R53]
MLPRPTIIRSAVAATALIAAVAMVVLPAQSASAHPTGSSGLLVEFTDEGVNVELQVPVLSFETATALTLDPDLSNAEAVAAVMVRQVKFTAPNGEIYGTTINEVALETINDVATVVGAGVLIPPGGDQTGAVTVAAELVIADDERHAIYVSSVSESGQRELVGVLTGASPSVTVVAGASSAGLAEMIAHGMHHIADGYDHLLFLGLLLVVAPLAVSTTRPRRWLGDPPQPARRTIVRVVQMVTAFTVGHSLSLLLVGMGWVALPVRIVESLVALTIVAAAIHCIRPLYRSREWLVAGVFGIIHGSAFATTIIELDLPVWDTVVAIVGFNFGIEFAQLFGVALTVPFLAAAAPSAGYSVVRLVIAAASIAAGIGWFIAIQLDTASIFEPVFEGMAGYPALTYLVFLAVMLSLVWSKSPRAVVMVEATA